MLVTAIRVTSLEAQSLGDAIQIAMQLRALAPRQSPIRFVGPFLFLGQRKLASYLACFAARQRAGLQAVFDTGADARLSLVHAA